MLTIDDFEVGEEVIFREGAKFRLGKPLYRHREASILTVSSLEAGYIRLAADGKDVQYIFDPHDIDKIPQIPEGDLWE